MPSWLLLACELVIPLPSHAPLLNALAICASMVAMGLASGRWSMTSGLFVMSSFAVGTGPPVIDTPFTKLRPLLGRKRIVPWLTRTCTGWRTESLVSMFVMSNRPGPAFWNVIVPALVMSIVMSLLTVSTSWARATLKFISALVPAPMFTVIGALNTWLPISTLMFRASCAAPVNVSVLGPTNVNVLALFRRTVLIVIGLFSVTVAAEVASPRKLATESVPLGTTPVPQLFGSSQLPLPGAIQRWSGGRISARSQKLSELPSAKLIAGLPWLGVLNVVMRAQAVLPPVPLNVKIISSDCVPLWAAWSVTSELLVGTRNDCVEPLKRGSWKTCSVPTVAGNGSPASKPLTTVGVPPTVLTMSS